MLNAWTESFPSQSFPALHSRIRFDFPAEAKYKYIHWPQVTNRFNSIQFRPNFIICVILSQYFLSFGGCYGTPPPTQYSYLHSSSFFFFSRNIAIWPYSRLHIDCEYARIAHRQTREERNDDAMLTARLNIELRWLCVLLCSIKCNTEYVLRDSRISRSDVGPSMNSYNGWNWNNLSNNGCGACIAHLQAHPAPANFSAAHWNVSVALWHTRISCQLQFHF